MKKRNRQIFGRIAVAAALMYGVAAPTEAAVKIFKVVPDTAETSPATESITDSLSDPSIIDPIVLEPIIVEPIIVEPIIVEPIIVEPIVLDPIVFEDPVGDPIGPDPLDPRIPVDPDPKDPDPLDPRIPVDPDPKDPDPKDPDPKDPEDPPTDPPTIPDDFADVEDAEDSASKVLLGMLESPQDNSYRSGIGVISGWHCDAEVVEVVIAGTTVETAYGTVREDTQDVCGDTDNGWGVLYNWNLFGDGLHTVEAYADGVLFASANVKVTTFGQEFMSGVSGNFTLEDFLAPGVDAEIEWQQAKQNFQIVNPLIATAGSTSNFEIGLLENPQDSAGQSGIGMLSGWICDAEEVIIEIDGTAIEAGYGTVREDTLEACGDIENGFGVLYNWNRFEEGTHTAVAYVDGKEFASTNFVTTHLGLEFVKGAEGMWELPNFPTLGTTTHVMWVEEIQNLVIYDVE